MARDAALANLRVEIGRDLATLTWRIVGAGIAIAGLAVAGCCASSVEMCARRSTRRGAADRERRADDSGRKPPETLGQSGLPKIRYRTPARRGGYRGGWSRSAWRPAMNDTSRAMDSSA